MSAYANDPRVTDMGGTGEIYEFGGADGPAGTVYHDRGWRVRIDGMAGSPQHVFATADEALRSVLGEPQALPAPGAALREIMEVR